MVFMMLAERFTGQIEFSNLPRVNNKEISSRTEGELCKPDIKIFYSIFLLHFLALCLLFYSLLSIYCNEMKR